MFQLKYFAKVFAQEAKDVDMKVDKVDGKNLRILAWWVILGTKNGFYSMKTSTLNCKKGSESTFESKDDF